LTREAYALDLRQYASWCQQCHLRLFEAPPRGHIERARDLEARGRARATITRRRTQGDLMTRRPERDNWVAEVAT